GHEWPQVLAENGYDLSGRYGCLASRYRVGVGPGLSGAKLIAGGIGQSGNRHGCAGEHGKRSRTSGYLRRIVGRRRVSDEYAQGSGNLEEAGGERDGGLHHLLAEQGGGQLRR